MGFTPCGAEYLDTRFPPCPEPAMQVQIATESVPANVIAALPVPEHRGCGWFDSSHELREGLVVTEDGDDALFQLWSQAQRSLH